MTEAPLSFTGPLIQAIQAGMKTQTRRLINPGKSWDMNPEQWAIQRPLGLDDGARVDYDQIVVPHLYEIGASKTLKPPWLRGGHLPDQIWAKEALYANVAIWPDQKIAIYGDGQPVIVKPGDRGAALEGPDLGGGRCYLLWRWKRDFLPPMFMPREASRLLLIPTAIRARRIQDITAADAMREGLPLDPKQPQRLARGAFIDLWIRINGIRSWEDNPWVWAITFYPLPGEDRSDD